jgi:hypothetical protein
MTKTTYELAIIVSDDVDVRDLDNAVGTLGKLDKQSQTTGSRLLSFQTLAVGAFAAVGTAALAAGAYSIQMAADAEEAAAKFETVFGAAAGRVGGDLDEFAEAVGRNRFELRRFAADLGDTFTPLGFAADESARLSTEVTKLAVDLASFNNLNEDDVAKALQSALVGNTENLLQFGVVANEAAIKNKALELGIEGVNGKLNAQQKAQAILALTIEGTSAAQGDALRTADSTTNQYRKMQAQMEETAVEIGATLLPAVNETLIIFNDLAEDGIPAFVAGMQTLGPILNTAAQGFGTLTSSGSAFRQFQSDLDELVNSTLTAAEKIAVIDRASDARPLVERLFGGTGAELDAARIDVIKDVIAGAEDLGEAIERLEAAGIDSEVPFLQGYLDEANLEQAVEGVESFDRALRSAETTVREATPALDANAEANARAAEFANRAADGTERLAEMIEESRRAAELRAEQIAAENALFSQSARYYEEIADAQSGLDNILADVYEVDADEIEAAQQRIESANLAIVESYREVAFEALLARTGVTEATLDLGVQLGLVTEADAAARLSFVETTTAVEALSTSYAFLNATTTDQAEAVQLIALGYTDSAASALELAAQIDGPFSEALRGANELTAEQIRLLDALDGRTVETNIRTNLLEGGAYAGNAAAGVSDPGPATGAASGTTVNSGGNTVNIYTGANEGDVREALSGMGY